MGLGREERNAPASDAATIDLEVDELHLRKMGKGE